MGINAKAVNLAKELLAGGKLTVIEKGYEECDNGGECYRAFALGPMHAADYYSAVAVNRNDLNFKEKDGEVVTGNFDEFMVARDEWVFWPTFYDLFADAIRCSNGYGWGFHTSLESLKKVNRSGNASDLYKTRVGSIEIDLIALKDILKSL